jgi:hypothetical protein
LLAIGIPVIVVGLIALGVHAVFAPTRFAVLRFGAVACAVPPGARAVYVQLALTERDEFPALATAELNGASNASLAQFGWLAPPLGYASGEMRPSQPVLAAAFSGSAHPRPLPSQQSNLVLRMTVDPLRSSSVDGVTLLIDNGEPALSQSLTFHLRMHNGQCTVGKA